MTEQNGWGDVPAIDHASIDHAPTGAEPLAPSRRRSPSRRALISIVAGGVALVLLLVAAGVGYGVGSARYAPENTVDAFLSELEAGHAARALADAHVTVSKDDVLLTDAAYARATDTVRSHRVLGSSTSGNGATVRVALDQGGRSVDATFQLTRSGTAWGVFPVWRMDPVSLGAVDVVAQGPAGTPITVAGERVTTAKDGGITLSALPGTYAVQVAGTQWLSAASASGTVTGFGGTASAPVDVQLKLTDAATSAATAAVNGWVDGCVASTDIEPTGCSFYAYGEDPSETYSNQRWTLNTRPSVTIGTWTGDGWLVNTTSPGSATFTASFTGPSGYGTGTAGPIPFSADGLITGFSDAGAAFTPAVTNGSGGSTGS